MKDNNCLILEIFKQDNALSMGVYAQDELSFTLKHYSQQQVSFTEIDKFCQESSALLGRPDLRCTDDPFLLNSLRKNGQLLWDLLVAKSVKERMKNSAACNIILSLDEELIHIPWELLYDGRDFLCLKYGIGRLIRTREASAPVRYRQATEKLRMLILANPTNDLKSAYLEGLYIRNRFDCMRDRVRIDFKSTHIDTMYVKKNLRDYDIVHYAGHCEYGAGKGAGWLLSDGLFSNDDVLSLGHSLSLPGLVFSNACHSAKTPAYTDDPGLQEKTYGLASAFLFSGTRHYIGSIRRIEDNASLVFAQEFYAQLIGGLSVGECLRLARVRLVREYGMSIASWTSHILYGDPGFVLFRPKARVPKIRLLAGIRLKYKERIPKALAALLIVAGILFSYHWLCAINPSTYLLFLKARNRFTGGGNNEAIAISKDIVARSPGFLPIYPTFADAYLRLGRYEQALQVYYDFARVSEKGRDLKSLACAYNGIGWVYHLKGDYPKAFDFFAKSLAISKENNDKLNEAGALRRMAVWYTDKEDYDKALELLTKSSEINRQRQHIYDFKYNLACDYFDIGLTFANKNDFESAREFYAKSMDLFLSLKLKNELSDCYFNIGEIYLFEKQYQKALDYYMVGLKIDRAHSNKANLASDYNMIGELYMEMDDFGNAQRYLDESVTVSLETGMQPELALAYHNLGILYKKRGWINKAREYLRSAQEIYSHIDIPAYQKLKKELLELAE